ncbi:hypothetical protein [Parasphingorhabdus sp.]|uniref:hypothetical protein n=1 Tax=Parasphingorhabdus sp. TaxID=2709688 RepID=UPI003002BF18
MTPNKFWAAMAPALLLLGCSEPQTPQNEPQPDRGASPAAAPHAEMDAPSSDAGATANDSAPDLSPPTLIPEAERGEKGARNILLSFARAIELGAFDQAWSLLSPPDKNKWSKSEFAGLFADLSAITVAIPGGTVEGAAGSLYYTAPVTITGTDGNGRPLRIEGKAVLRRVNDVEGATAAQLRWHFETLTLDWTH